MLLLAVTVSHEHRGLARQQYPVLDLCEALVLAHALGGDRRPRHTMAGR
jgi:hypothetical protein